MLLCLSLQETFDLVAPSCGCYDVFNSFSRKKSFIAGVEFLDMSSYGVVSVICFYGTFVFTEAVLLSLFCLSYMKTSTWTGEAVNNVSGVAANEVFVMSLIYVICECLTVRMTFGCSFV